MQVDLRDAALTITDGTPNTVEVTIGEGNLTFSEKRNIDYKLDRGRIKDSDGNVIDRVREGDEVPMEVSFDFVWDLVKTDGVYIEDAIQGLNSASAWVSSDTDEECQPYSVDLEFKIEPDCGSEIRTYKFTHFRCESIDSDASAGTISCSGKCNEVHPTVT